MAREHDEDLQEEQGPSGDEEPLGRDEETDQTDQPSEEDEHEFRSG